MKQLRKNTAQKIKFYIKIFSVNMTKSARNCGLVTFNEEAQMESLIFCVVKIALLNLIASLKNAP